MTSQNVFLNKGKKWIREEDNQLKSQYVNQNMNILDIAKIHQRTVGGIISRLKTIEVLSPFLQPEEYFSSVRGYAEYIADEEFRTQEKEYKKEKKIIIQDNEQQREIDIIKQDIANIKKDVKEILHLLHSIYEFEE